MVKKGVPRLIPPLKTMTSTAPSRDGLLLCYEHLSAAAVAQKTAASVLTTPGATAEPST